MNTQSLEIRTLLGQTGLKGSFLFEKYSDKHPDIFRDYSSSYRPYPL